MTVHTTAHLAGTPCWMDVATPDLAKTKDFYTGLFGWEAKDGGPEYADYLSFDLDGKPVAGAMLASDDGIPAGWCLYFASEDIDATIGAAVLAGATVVQPKEQVLDLGSMAFLTDPAGSFFGLWQSAGHIGFGVTEVVGAPGWFENYTAAFAKTTEFYGTAFGWQFESMGDSDDFRYSTGKVGEAEAAGVMEINKSFPADFPPHWETYISVADADASAARAVELGGAVVEGPDDTPYGRLATLTDPNGARIKIMGENVGF